MKNDVQQLATAIIPCFLLFSFPLHENEAEAFRDLSQDNINNFSDVLREFTNNFLVNENDNVKVNLFMYGLHRLYNECFPIRGKGMLRIRLLKSSVSNKLINIINSKFRL